MSRSLSVREAQFAEHYADGKSARAAAIAVGAKAPSAGTIGYRMLRRPRVQAEVERIRKAAEAREETVRQQARRYFDKHGTYPAFIDDAPRVAKALREAVKEPDFLCQCAEKLGFVSRKVLVVTDWRGAEVKVKKMELFEPVPERMARSAVLLDKEIKRQIDRRLQPLDMPAEAAKLMDQWHADTRRERRAEAQRERRARNRKSAKRTGSP